MWSSISLEESHRGKQKSRGTQNECPFITIQDLLPSSHIILGKLLTTSELVPTTIKKKIYNNINSMGIILKIKKDNKKCSSVKFSDFKISCVTYPQHAIILWIKKTAACYLLDSVQFSGSVVSNSWWSHESQQARPPCPSPTSRVHPKPCPLCWWCHPTILSSVIPFSSFPQSFLASGSFQMSQLFASGGQSIGVSASTSVLPMNTQDWSPLGWTGWISLHSKGL